MQSRAVSCVLSSELAGVLPCKDGVVMQGAERQMLRPSFVPPLAIRELQRRGNKHAVAVGSSILVTIWQLQRNDQARFVDLGRGSTTHT